MRAGILFCAALLVLGPGAAGCYPDEGEPLRVGVGLAGLGVSQQALESWISWEAGQREEPFAMDTADHNFFLDLVLESDDPSAVLDLAGGQVTHTADRLDLELWMGDCLDCRLSLAIFLAQPDLQTYSGLSQTFVVPLPADQPAVELEAELAATGTVVVDLAQAAAAGPPQVAAVDDAANVRLPPVTAAADGDRFQAVLADMPVGRDLLVQVARDGGWLGLGSVRLEQPGQTLTVSE